jgi:endonuclease/exonuclease/phosphatase family metal-dependent hydrolase
MRITSWNILHGMAIPPAANGQPAITLAQASQHLAAELSPDFIGVQECDFNLVRSGESNQIAEIAASIGATHFAFAPCIIGTPGEKWRKLHAGDQRIISNKDVVGTEIGSEKSEGGYGIGIASSVEVTKWHRLDLGNSPIGMPLLIPGDESGPGKVRPIYIRDEPRVALAATRVDGYTIINTHLSFVPGYNIKQLRTLKKWALELERETGTTAIIMGDLNLPKNLPVVASQWRSLATQATYPSWGAKIQFDYILSKAEQKAQPLATVPTGVSDHLPLSVEITL